MTLIFGSSDPTSLTRLNMSDVTERKRHDLHQAVRVLNALIEFIEQGFDFSTNEGHEIIKEAKNASALLRNEITKNKNLDFEKQSN